MDNFHLAEIYPQQVKGMKNAMAKAAMLAYIEQLRMKLEEAQGEHQPPPTYKAMRPNIRLLHESNDTIKKEVGELRRKVYSLHNQLNLAQNTSNKTNSKTFGEFWSDIYPEILSRLIRWCHPWHDGDRNVSNEVTVWLISIGRQLQRRPN